MEFRFEASQEFQLTAIGAVTGLFEGQPKVDNLSEFSLGSVVCPNRLDLTADEIRENLLDIQAVNGITQDGQLQYIEAQITTEAGIAQARFPNFSVEMETGTGKTYVYIRTMLELYERYGLRKYIIVVPSVAVREGVLKTLKMTHKHLKEVYGNLPYRYASYDSANLSQVRQFALSSSVEILIMTIDSFNKSSNVIKQSTDRLSGETPIHLIQSCRPVLVLDEPQNMESELRIKSLSGLNPLFALRYSATHKNPYNLVYRLTPFEAYRQGLVKKIEVAGVEQQNDANAVFIRVDELKSEKKTVTASIAVHMLMKDGTIKEKVITVKPNENLEKKTNRSEYADFTVDEIDLFRGFIRFTNGIEVRKGETRGTDKEAIFEAQIQYTIKEHFDKQEFLRERGIKVLSLFFIDKVDNYALEDGIIRKLFIKCFNELKGKYDSWKDVNPLSAQAAYFASKKNSKTGEVVFEDTKTGTAEKDKQAYNLIMKDKERLLSFDEPTCFIFSHSALKEGWDNPNVFQICTLNQTRSELKKRQEIGRGVRLAVNQDGERVRDDRINVLTVVANESYERYVERLQSEIVEEFGNDGAAPKPPDARKKVTVKLRKNYTLKEEFKVLWDKIRQKTRYSVRIDSERLITDVLRVLDVETINPPRVTISKAGIDIGKKDVFEAMHMSRAKTIVDLRGRYPLPNLIELMLHHLEHTTPPIRLTRKTLLAIFTRTKVKKAATDNPQEFATIATRIIKEKLSNQLVDGIQYQKITDWYEMTQFIDIPSWEGYLVRSEDIHGNDGKSVYDYVIYDSEVEKLFAEELEKRKDVRLYVKLPGWFTVPTPVGEYNPDWAIVMDNPIPDAEPVLYLVRETKGESFWTNPHLNEKRKVDCGKRHFEGGLQIDYKVVTKAENLP